MRIGVQADIKRATRKLNNAAKKQIPFAASKSLNELAFKISRKTLPEKAQQKFKGGATAFTKRGFKYIKSTKRKLTSIVYVDSGQANYMKYMIDGGTRKPNSLAILSPTKHSKLNKFGNFTKNTVNKMMTDKVRYFSGTPKGQAPTPGNTGVWQRYGGKLSGGGKKIKMVARYKRSQQYSRSFPFDKYVAIEVESLSDGFMPRFKKNLNYAISTAR